MKTKLLLRAVIVSYCSLKYRALTGVVLDKLLEGLELSPGGDVVASVVQFTDLVMLDVISLDVIPVLDGERVRPWNGDNTCVNK